MVHCSDCAGIRQSARHPPCAANRRHRAEDTCRRGVKASVVNTVGKQRRADTEDNLVADLDGIAQRAATGVIDLLGRGQRGWDHGRAGLQRAQHIGVVEVHGARKGPIEQCNQQASLCRYSRSGFERRVRHVDHAVHQAARRAAEAERRKVRLLGVGGGRVNLDNQVHNAERVADAHDITGP